MFDPEKITFFAKTDARGQQMPFGIKAKDRQRHMYVVGKTGMGKSTLLENMAAQDIANGEGMAFIDPHGSAAQTLLDYVPEHRLNDVIYFAPFDLANPIAFNVMEDVGVDKRHLVVSGLMSTFKKIWEDAWSARMEYILTNALLALIEYPDTTLLSVNRMFSDKAFRTRVVDYIKDPAVKAFWVDEFANYTERFAAEALPAIQNKIGQFTGNPLIRNIIGQPKSSFDIRTIMDEKKILIMNLSKGLVGETNANLLGSMLTTRIYLAAMSRADMPVEQMKKMPNFYFYVDEFQSFANATFANILSEARKYHLNLIIAHQYIEQMEEDVRNAVFGNVGTTVAFRVGPFDAEVLETVFSPRFLAADLVNLGFAQIYLTLMIDGIGSQPFSATTLPPVEKPRVSCKEMVIAASRKNYTATREMVEKIVADLHMPAPAAPKPPQKDRPNPGKGEGKSDAQKTPVPVRPLAPMVPETSAPLPPRVEANPVLKNNTTAISGIRTPSASRPNRPTETPKQPYKQSYPSAAATPIAPRTVAPTPKVEDLRAILARLAQGEAIKESEKTKPAVTPLAKDVSTTPHNESLAGRQEKRSNHTPPQTLGNKKAEPTVLRAALADVLKNINTSVPTTKDAISATPTQSAVLTPVSTEPSQEAALVSAEVSKPAAVVPTAPDYTEMERMAAEAEALMASLDTPPTAAALKSVDDPLSPEKIGRILKQGKDERSPFAP